MAITKYAITFIITTYAKHYANIIETSLQMKHYHEDIMPLPYTPLFHRRRAIYERFHWLSIFFSFHIFIIFRKYFKHEMRLMKRMKKRLRWYFSSHYESITISPHYAPFSLITMMMFDYFSLIIYRGELIIIDYHDYYHFLDYHYFHIFIHAKYFISRSRKNIIIDYLCHFSQNIIIITLHITKTLRAMPLVAITAERTCIMPRNICARDIITLLAIITNTMCTLRHYDAERDYAFHFRYYERYYYTLLFSLPREPLRHYLLSLMPSFSITISYFHIIATWLRSAITILISLMSMPLFRPFSITLLHLFHWGHFRDVKHFLYYVKDYWLSMHWLFHFTLLSPIFLR